MFSCTCKRSTGVTTIKNKGWDFGEKGVFGDELVCLFYINGITPGGSHWHNAEVTEKQIWAEI